MTRIGIVSENFHHDSQAVRALLTPEFKTVQFIPVLKSINGTHLDRIEKVKDALTIAFKKKRLDFVLFVRDLDGLQSEQEKIEDKRNWFSNFQHFVSSKNVFFLVIYELEALILADIATFNQVYNVSITTGSSIHQPKPKEFLVSKTKKSNLTYHESHTPNLFSQLDFDTIYQNHQGDISFQSFINELNDCL